MGVEPLLHEILGNEALTRGLGDPEARILIEWLVERVEFLIVAEPDGMIARAEVRQLIRHARAISCFVRLWCHDGAHGPAIQLAGAERFTWPLPAMNLDPCELMHEILRWETPPEDSRACAA